MAINMRPFPEQAAFFARCSEIAYLDEKEGRAKFKALGFDATLIDARGSQAYWLKDDDDLIIVCRGTQPTEFADIASDLNAIPVASSTGIGRSRSWPMARPAFAPLRHLSIFDGKRFLRDRPPSGLGVFAAWQ